jgi:hypothetical protein
MVIFRCMPSLNTTSGLSKIKSFACSDGCVRCVESSGRWFKASLHHFFFELALPEFAWEIRWRTFPVARLHFFFFG